MSELYDGRAISQGWDYVNLDPFDRSPPEPREDPLTAEEKLAAAIEAQGTPPCGNIRDVAGRCKWWTHCASQEMACQKYQEWHSRNSARPLAFLKKRLDRKREIYPSRDLYNKIFAD